MLAGGLLTAAAAVVAAPAANTAPGPCSSSPHASRLSTTSDRIGRYLANNPDVNQSLTRIARQPRAQARANLRQYMTDHPNVANDLQNMRAPLSAQRDRCDLQAPPLNVLVGLGSYLNGGLRFGGGTPFNGRW